MSTVLEGVSARGIERLDMALLLPEHFGALNTPLATRKGEVKISYMDHHPRLLIRTPNSTEECVAYMNTRTKMMIPVRPKQESNLLLCSHIFAEMDRVQCVLALSYDVEPKTQRKRMRLQIRSPFARRTTHTLHWLWKGTESPWMDHFDYSNHPLYRKED